MIVIMGVPGAGKSSLSKLMSVRDRLPLFEEPVTSNPYLTEYYKDPARYAFNMQIFLVHKRFLQAQQAQHLDQCIMDMHLTGNDVFARLQYANGYMTKTDHETYTEVSNTLQSQLKAPDLVVYLQCSTRVAVNRIMTRGRKAELEIPLSYWYDLGEVYERWYETYEGSRKMLINVDDIDFVREESEEDYVIDCINEYLKMP